MKQTKVKTWRNTKVFGEKVNYSKGTKYRPRQENGSRSTNTVWLYSGASDWFKGQLCMTCLQKVILNAVSSLYEIE